MDKALNVSFIYAISAGLSLLLAGGYCALVRKKEIWLIWLYFSVFVANLGYFTLSISKSLEEALLANRIAYLGCVFLPLFMLMTIMKVCALKCTKIARVILIGVSIAIFLIAATSGYLDCYYKEVTLVFVNGMAKLEKVYGPLHSLYFVYLFAYFGIMIGVICYSVMKKKVSSYKHSLLLLVVVFLNIAIWLVEQFIRWDFEFLAVSYIISELLLLLLYSMIQDYELLEVHNEELHLQTDEQEQEFRQDTINWDELAILSAREKDVLQKMLENKKRKEIAEELFITENTVKKHISNIFTKLEIENRNELFERIKQKRQKLFVSLT